MWTTGDIFSGVYKDSTSAIMVTPLREEEENGSKLFHNTAGTVYLVKPDLIHRTFVHQDRSGLKQQLWCQFTLPRRSLVFDFCSIAASFGL